MDQVREVLPSYESKAATEKNPTYEQEENDERVGCAYAAPHHESLVLEEVIFRVCIGTVEEYRQMDIYYISAFEDSPEWMVVKSTMDNRNNPVSRDLTESVGSRSSVDNCHSTVF